MLDLLDVNWDPEGCPVAAEGEQIVGFALGLVRREPMEGTFGIADQASGDSAWGPSSSPAVWSG
jgi:hypothetical protein